MPLWVTFCLFSCLSGMEYDLKALHALSIELEQVRKKPRSALPAHVPSASLSSITLGPCGHDR